MPPKKNPTAGGTSRQSNRLIAQQPNRTIDEAARRRRIQRQLETLEKDNFQEDPHLNLTWHKAAPKFADELVFAGQEGGKKKRKRKHESASKVSGAEQATKKGKKLVASLTKTRFRKSFAQLLEEFERKREEDLKAASSSGGAAANRDRDSPPIAPLTYSEIAAPPSRFPPRKFCAVCGQFARYTCVRCATRFCSIPCRDMHVDTRCLKWTV